MQLGISLVKKRKKKVCFGGERVDPEIELVWLSFFFLPNFEYVDENMYGPISNQEGLTLNRG